MIDVILFCTPAYLSAPSVNSFERHGRLHGTLKSIMSLAPSGQTGLFATLSEMFPYKLQSKHTQLVFISQLFTMCEYLPHFQQRILDLVVSKCLEFDADIIVEDFRMKGILAEQDEFGLSPEDMFLLETEDSGVNVHVKNSHVGPVSSCRRVDTSSSDLADKLDGILAAFIRFIHTQFTQRDGHGRERTFLQLLGIFERRVLPTQRSKFVQFVVFYMCSQHPPYAELFLRRLLEIFLQQSNLLVQRHCAVVYFGSFLCHSKCCTPQAIRYCILMTRCFPQLLLHFTSNCVCLSVCLLACLLRPGMGCWSCFSGVAHIVRYTRRKWRQISSA